MVETKEPQKSEIYLKIDETGCICGIQMKCNADRYLQMIGLLDVIKNKLIDNKQGEIMIPDKKGELMIPDKTIREILKKKEVLKNAGNT